MALPGGGCLILENMTGLGGLPATCELTVLPLPVGGGDRSPVRAFARPESAEGEGFSVDQLL